MDFTAENVEKAVLSFYSSGQSNHEWLTRAQLSSQAWSFSWELVKNDKNHEIQFFGANTLAIKVSKCFSEIPKTDLPRLKDELMMLFINKAVTGPKIVLTKISVAVANLIIHSIPDNWQNPIQDLINLLQLKISENGITILPPFLELLTIIPEEYTSQIMTSKRRSTVKVTFSQSQSSVFAMLSQLFREKEHISPTALIQAIKCLNAWFVFGISPDLANDIVDHLLDFVYNEELYETSLDMLSSILSHPEMYAYVNTLKKIVPRILQLERLFTKLMNDESYEMVNPLANFFVTFGETHSRFLLDWCLEEEGQVYSIAVVSIICRISGCKGQFPTDETFSETSFGFWYIFQDDIIACDHHQFQTCVTLFGKAYFSLVQSLREKAMYPKEYDGFNCQQQEQFRCYRTDIADTIMYCHNILKKDLLYLLNTELDNAISNCQINNASWPQLEVCLFLWSAVGEAMAEEDEENSMLVQFLAKLPSISSINHPKVVLSLLDCIGCFAEWLASYPTLVVNLVPIIMSSILNPELSLSATMALKDLSRDCSVALKICADDIIAKSYAAIRSNQLAKSECARLMYPIGKLISLNGHQSALTNLQPIVSPFLGEFKNILSLQQNTNSIMEIKHYIKLFMTLFQSMDFSQNDEVSQHISKTHPVVILMSELLPLLKTVTEFYVKDEKLMDNVLNLIKSTVKTVILNDKGQIFQFVEFISDCYCASLNGTAIDLAKYIVVVANNDPDLKPALVALFGRISMKTMQLLSTSQPLELTSLVAIYYHNMNQLLKKNTDYFGTQAIDLNEIFQCSCFCIELPESSTLKYVSQFITTILTLGLENKYLEEIISNNAKLLFRQVFSCIGKNIDKNLLEYYSEIISSMLKCMFSKFCELLEEFTRENGFPSDKVSIEEKENFGKLIIKEQSNKRKLNDLIREFSLGCSGYRS